jgi:hypothetical protein
MSSGGPSKEQTSSGPRQSTGHGLRSTVCGLRSTVYGPRHKDPAGMVAQHIHYTYSLLALPCLALLGLYSTHIQHAARSTQHAARSTQRTTRTSKQPASSLAGWRVTDGVVESDAPVILAHGPSAAKGKRNLHPQAASDASSDPPCTRQHTNSRRRILTATGPPVSGFGAGRLPSAHACHFAPAASFP